MGVSLEPTPIAWPSLSDLAQMLGMKLSALSRLPAVRRQPTTRIGREVKVPPAVAVAILVERGLSQQIAAAGVQHVIDRRQERVPALRAPARGRGPDAGVRLVRSSVGSSRAARLTPFRIPHAGPRGPRLTAPDMERFERRDRALGGRTIPIEGYVYGDR